MKPAPFEFLAPDSLDQALQALDAHGYDAKILAGGQSLIPAMNFRLMQPAVLIDLNRIASLSYIEPTPDGGLRIGAMTRQRMLERSALVAERAPLLAEIIPNIAHPQIRNRGTLGGSLAHADPAAELPVAALALEARIRLQRSSGERWVNAADFFQFMFMTSLEPDEILTAVEFPAMPANTGYAFEEFSRRHGDYALAGVAALVTVDDAGVCSRARLVYLNLGDGPLVSEAAAGQLHGAVLGPPAIRAAAQAAAEEVQPAGNIHATPDYQRHLATILTERALQRAVNRLNGRIAHA